jgi:hypothetical protein
MIGAGRKSDFQPQMDHLINRHGFEGCWRSSSAQTIVAAMLVAVGSCIRGRLLVGVGLPITVAGFVVAVRAVWHFGANRGVNPRRILAWGFVAMALTGVFGAVTAGGPAYDLTKRTYFAAALLVLGIWPRLDERGKARAMNALFVLFAAVHLLGPFLVPDPHIDNWAWTQACLKALLHGVQPYTLTMADVPGAEYARSPISAYPYPPLTLVVLAPAFLIFGDYRIALAVSMSAAVLLLRTAGRSLRLGREQLDAASRDVLRSHRAGHGARADRVQLSGGS